MQKTLFRTLPTLLISLALLLVTIIPLAPNAQAQTISTDDFNPGNIIDDSVFFNTASISVAEIQAFLEARMPNCDTNGDQLIYGMTRADYGASRGYPAPFICVRDYSETISGVVNGGSDLCSGSISAGTKTAAQIIYEASIACGINPKVLIVLLEKEQGLISDDWPWQSQYNKATGYGCPDTAACDTQYYGFFNQVYNAAKAFRRYEANPFGYNFRANRNNFISYQANAPSCGGSNVFIENQATANLYIYTPYQPNQAALDNTPGTGDACSAYGNRNFWYLFNLWFGNTVGPDYHATYRSQSSYPVIDLGLTRTIHFQFENTGRVDWKDDVSATSGETPIHLAITNPINKVSSFRTSSWLGPNRPTGVFAAVYENDSVTLAADQHTVTPGQIARFEFEIAANTDIAPGVYREFFQPVAEGIPNYGWHMTGFAFLDIGVNNPVHQAAYHTQSAYPTIAKGGSAPAFISFRNAGSNPWFDDTSNPLSKRPIHLATSWPINRGSQFSSTWNSASRPGSDFSAVYESDGVTLTSNQHIVYPGQIGKFEFTLSAPIDTPAGFYQEYFEPVIEGGPGYSWNTGTSAWLGVTVTD